MSSYGAKGTRTPNNWLWAAENLDQVEQARREFDGKAKTV